jgi:hypothetical protein
MRRMRNDDDGAVAVVVALLMVAFLGFGVLVVDVGQVYAEQRQLRNGADAAVLSLAVDCPNPAVGCAAGGAAATALANQNALDGAATISEVCGNGPGLTPCSPASGIGPWDCRAVPSNLSSAQYVQARTRTRLAGGGTLLPPVLAQVLVPGYTGTDVRACARASWGPPASLTSQLPLTISRCEFQQYTAGGLAPPPPYTSGYPTERKIYFHNNTTAAPPCPAGPSGADLPGGFGWLDTSENCVATTDTSNWVDDSTGAPPPSSCSNAELLAMRGQIVNIPIFDQTNGLNGANGEYHIVGYAAFYLTGYRFPSAQARSLVTNTFPCGGSDHCISGFFTIDTTPTGGTIGTGPSMGSTVVQLSG